MPRALTATRAEPRHPARVWPALLVGACGLLAALVLPFAPVTAERATLTWPVPGEPVTSTTALLVPYRPAMLVATIPCPALRATAAEVTVLSTGASGLRVSTGPGGAALRTGGRSYPLAGDGAGPDCRTVIRAGPEGMTVTDRDGSTRIAGPVPEVFGFRTDLRPPDAAGLRVTVQTASPFGTSPAPVKTVLIAVQLVAAATALALLGCRLRPRRPRVPHLWWIDAGVVAVLAGWAVIGPLAVDDGWATTIARTFAATGEAGNYYRWWNAPEVPFALSQQVLSRLTELSLAPLWLRLPSTVLGVATWLVLSRGVLPAALHAGARSPRVRLLAAVLLLAAWLPFNLGTRPESYVALGVTMVLALVWRARTPAGLGWATLAAALTVPVSPTAVMIVAPLVVFAPRMAGVLRRASGRLWTQVLLLCCVAAVSLTAIFADQTWSALLTATDWHRYFGPTLSWYQEPERYSYLVSGDQQGSAVKRLPVLLSVAMLPVVGLFAWRRRTALQRSAIRLAAVLVLALLVLAVVPSKWSYHFGAVAGLFASFLTVSVVLVAHRTRTSTDRRDIVAAAVGGVVLCAAAAMTFAGPNAWWISTVYDVAWSTGSVRPAGLPLDNPLLWVGAAAAGVLGVSMMRRRFSIVAAPAVVVVIAAGTAVAVLLGSFVAAPLRRPEGSLAIANINWLTGGRGCGLADDIEVLPDGPPLAAVDDADRSDGFAALAGFPAGAPPPEAPGRGASTTLWGSASAGPQGTGSITTRWFALPALQTDQGIAVSLLGRTDGANSLSFEFGRTAGADVVPLGARTPADRVAIDEDPEHPLWRSIGVDAAAVPAGADRIRLSAVDGRTDESGYLAFTGPRLRSVVGLGEFLADHPPVLIGWPQAFLFPCVHDIAEVSAGVAQTPNAVIESPRPFFTEDRVASLGGTFAALAEFGELQEIPSRLRGHPDVDWGTVLITPAGAVHDAYTLTVSRETRWGFDEVGRVAPQR